MEILFGEPTRPRLTVRFTTNRPVTSDEIEILPSTGHDLSEPQTTSQRDEDRRSPHGFSRSPEPFGFLEGEETELLWRHPEPFDRRNLWA
jgi:hypothetical protein